MKLDYTFETPLVRRIYYVTHKGKGRNFQTEVHSHDVGCYEIIYVDYGTVNLMIDDKAYTLDPGHSIIVPGGKEHWFSGDSGVPFDFLNILFEGEVSEDLVAVNLPGTKRTRELLEQLKRESEEALPHFREATGCLLVQLIISFIRHKDLPIPHKLPESATHRNYRSESVKRALAIIEREYASPLGMDELSQSVGVSKSYLRALLKSETGESFSALLQKQRVSAAKHLLRESDHSLSEIAAAVGYQSLPFFFKVFKRWTEMTPMAYSRSLGEPTERMT